MFAGTLSRTRHARQRSPARQVAPAGAAELAVVAVSRHGRGRRPPAQQQPRQQGTASTPSRWRLTHDRGRNRRHGSMRCGIAATTADTQRIPPSSAGSRAAGDRHRAQPGRNRIPRRGAPASTIACRAVARTSRQPAGRSPRAKRSPQPAESHRQQACTAGRIPARCCSSCQRHTGDEAGQRRRSIHTAPGFAGVIRNRWHGWRIIIAGRSTASRTGAPAGIFSRRSCVRNPTGSGLANIDAVLTGPLRTARSIRSIRTLPETRMSIPRRPEPRHLQMQ